MLVINSNVSIVFKILGVVFHKCMPMWIMQRIRINTRSSNRYFVHVSIKQVCNYNELETFKSNFVQGRNK